MWGLCICKVGRMSSIGLLYSWKHKGTVVFVGGLALEHYDCIQGRVYSLLSVSFYNMH